MKKLFAAAVATACLSLAGIAGAAEPVQLTDSQMDSVSAGQTSVATTGGFALIGVVASGADTGARVTYRPNGTVRSRTTTAGAATISSGLFVAAGASAGSSF